MTNNTTPVAAQTDTSDWAFDGGTVGQLMRFDDDRLRVGVMAVDSDDETARLALYLRADSDQDRPVVVTKGDEFDIGPYQIRVVTLSTSTVAVRVKFPEQA